MDDEKDIDEHLIKTMRSERQAMPKSPEATLQDKLLKNGNHLALFTFLVKKSQNSPETLELLFAYEEDKALNQLINKYEPPTSSSNPYASHPGLYYRPMGSVKAKDLLGEFLPVHTPIQERVRTNTEKFMHSLKYVKDEYAFLFTEKENGIMGGVIKKLEKHFEEFNA